MRCRFVKEIFHNKDNGYCIFVYHTKDSSVPEAARDTRYKGKGFQFTATGTGLPAIGRIWPESLNALLTRLDYGRVHHVVILAPDHPVITGMRINRQNGDVGMRNAEITHKRLIEDF